MREKYGASNKERAVKDEPQKFLRLGDMVFVAWHKCIQVGAHSFAKHCEPVTGLWAVPGDSKPWTTQQLMEKFG